MLRQTITGELNVDPGSNIAAEVSTLLGLTDSP
jgi:hypothetical protein